MTLLKNKFIAGTAAAALSLGSSFGIANAQDSNSVMGAPTQQTSISVPTPEQVRQTNVPMLDARAYRVEVAEARTAREAKQAQTLMVFFAGDDREFFAEAREATRMAIAGGLNVRGMTVANGDEGNFVHVYLMGLPYGPRDENRNVIPIRPEDGDIKARVLDRIFEAEYQLPRILREIAEREALMTASREP